MTEAESKPVYKAVTKQIKANRELTIKTEPFRKTWYLAIRYMWITPDGELAFDRNGINMPLEFAPAILREAIDVLNEATGSNFSLVEVSADQEG